jgi:hypothetical protein
MRSFILVAAFACCFAPTAVADCNGTAIAAVVTAPARIVSAIADNRSMIRSARQQYRAVSSLQSYGSSGGVAFSGGSAGGKAFGYGSSGTAVTATVSLQMTHTNTQSFGSGIAHASATARAALGLKGHHAIDLSSGRRVGVGFSTNNPNPRTCFHGMPGEYASVRGRDGWYATLVVH